MILLRFSFGVLPHKPLRVTLLDIEVGPYIEDASVHRALDSGRPWTRAKAVSASAAVDTVGWCMVVTHACGDATIQRPRHRHHVFLLHRVVTLTLQR